MGIRSKEMELKKLSLFFGVFIVSFSGIAVKLSTISPISLALYRVLFAEILFFAFSWKKFFHIDNLKEFFIILSAGFFLGIHFILWISSFRYTTVAGAIIPLILQPIVTSLLAFLIFGEILDKREAFAISIVFSGILMMNISDFLISERLGFGDFLSILGSIFVSFFTLIARKLVPKMGTILFNARVYAISLIFIFIFSISLNVVESMDLQNLWIAIFLGFGCSFLGYSLITNSLKFFKTSSVSMALVGEPVLGIFWSVTLLKEVPTMNQILGLIISGIGLMMFYKVL